MIMSLVAIAIVALITYLWVLQGFFSALLHLLCVIIAGAIAFAFWEPMAYAILENVDGNKGFLSFLPGMAWGVSLVVPFAVSLAILRLITDKLVRAKAQLDRLPDFLGGGVCGFISGTITAGITVMAISSLWMDTDWWYQRLSWNDNGRLQRTTKLIYPVDDITASIYKGLSTTTFSTETPLAKLYPNLADVPSMIRHTLFDGNGRPTISPGQFRVLGGFIVDADENFQSAFSSPQEIRSAISGEPNPYKPVTDIEGNPLDVPGSTIVGYALAFTSGARERGSSQVVLGAAQLRLVAENDAGEVVEVFPFSFMTRAEQRRDDPEARYLRFDFLQGDFPATYQEAEPKMAFEFLIPQGYKPAWLYVKNTRVDVHPGVINYDTITSAQRATRVRDRSLIEMTQRQFDDSEAVTVNVGQNIRAAGIEIKNSLPLGLIIRDGDNRGLKVNEGKKIVEGEQNWPPAALDNRALDKALRISEFQVPGISTLVQITVTPTGRIADPAVNLTELPLSAAPTDEPIYLIDDAGYAYACIGYAYKDRQQVKIRYTRSSVLSGLRDLPSVPSRSRRDQEIVLLFEIQKGRSIAALAVGDKIYIKFDPPIVVQTR